MWRGSTELTFVNFVSAILLKAYYEAKREAARVAKQTRQMEVPSFKNAVFACTVPRESDL